MFNLARVSACSLSQWALDFSGNKERIIKSILKAKELGARYRVGSELEIPGYSCEDHFLETDTIYHSWQVLCDLLEYTCDIICDFGMPVFHHGILYNCRVIVLNSKILLIRPKLILADDGNYREPRWFSSWKLRHRVEDHMLEYDFIRNKTGQQCVPFGEAVLQLADTQLGFESCEELFVPNSPNIDLSSGGVEIISNSSSSHHELRKLNQRIDLILNATRKSGGIYIYSNQRSCDGGRLYFDGCPLIACNGSIIAMGMQFSISEVEVIVASVDIDSIQKFRMNLKSHLDQSSFVNSKIHRIAVYDFSLTYRHNFSLEKSLETIQYVPSEEEIGYGPACWLWDYLRRSKMGGFFLALSGGIDSSCTATIVYIMCKIVIDHVYKKDLDVINDLKRITGWNDDSIIQKLTPQTLCNRILFACYMKSSNSSQETLDNARRLAEEIGASFSTICIDSIIDKFNQIVAHSLNVEPRFKVYGGTNTENLALQNVQARSRMVLAYYLAQLSIWALDSKNQADNNSTSIRPQGLLVLGTSNVDEALRGYFTKYDCSSADINPIGGISKVDLKRFLVWAEKNLCLPSLNYILSIPSTAELEPITSNYKQTDEQDMGMTYAELNTFSKLRKTHKCGPYSMFLALASDWTHLRPSEIAEKVKKFFFYYSINRHKLTTLTPSYHAESYSVDDNRYDLRPFLYNSKWNWQFEQIDKLAFVMDANFEKNNRNLTN